MFAVLPLPTAISDIFSSVSETGEITIADRYGLLAVLLQPSISDEERAAVDRLLYALKRGRVRLVNKLSALH